jgi:hypothetical protein
LPYAGNAYHAAFVVIEATEAWLAGNAPLQKVLEAETLALRVTAEQWELYRGARKRGCTGYMVQYAAAAHAVAAAGAAASTAAVAATSGDLDKLNLAEGLAVQAAEDARLWAIEGDGIVPDEPNTPSQRLTESIDAVETVMWMADRAVKNASWVNSIAGIAMDTAESAMEAVEDARRAMETAIKASSKALDAATESVVAAAQAFGSANSVIAAVTDALAALSDHSAQYKATVGDKVGGHNELGSVDGTPTE